MTLYINMYIIKKPRYKPSKLTMTVTKTGDISIRRQTFGPRGGVVMEESILLTHEEWETLKSQET